MLSTTGGATYPASAACSSCFSSRSSAAALVLSIVSRISCGICLIQALMIAAFSAVSWPSSDSFWISQDAVCVHVGLVICLPMLTISSSTMWM